MTSFFPLNCVIFSIIFYWHGYDLIVWESVVSNEGRWWSLMNRKGNRLASLSNHRNRKAPRAQVEEVLEPLIWLGQSLIPNSDDSTWINTGCGDGGGDGGDPSTASSPTLELNGERTGREDLDKFWYPLTSNQIKWCIHSKILQTPQFAEICVPTDSKCEWT